jgi:hypothetical protein
MDCKICMEDDILVELIVDLKCGHCLCTSCLEKLVLNQCPYCRRDIDTNNVLKEDNNLDYYLLIEIPVSYVENSIQRKPKKKKNKKKVKSFVSNSNRGEYERKSKKWKNEKIKECV